MITLTGKCSWFGGPDDMGVEPDEGLALYDWFLLDPYGLFLKEQPPGTTGLARRLNPEAHYIACRWDYDRTPVEWLRKATILVTNLKHGPGPTLIAYAVDWGPNEDTGRVADLSLGLMKALGLQTGDEVMVTIQEPDKTTMPTAEYIHGEHWPEHKRSLVNAMLWFGAIVLLWLVIWLTWDAMR